MNIEMIKPEEIEARSFSIILEELKQKNIVLHDVEAPVIIRCIHTTADLDYAKTLHFSDNWLTIKDLIRNGASLVTDTNMALTGINKKEFARYGGQYYCFMADESVADEAKKRGVTRASVSMERAMSLPGPVIYVSGNAPTALITLAEAYDKNDYKPAFVVGVPVGFVNVEAAKEMIMERDIPHIVNVGRKGGSNVAAAIINAVLYSMRE